MEKFRNEKWERDFPSIHVHFQPYIDLNNILRISKVIVIVMNKRAFNIYGVFEFLSLLPYILFLKYGVKVKMRTNCSI